MRGRKAGRRPAFQGKEARAFRSTGVLAYTALPRFDTIWANRRSQKGMRWVRRFLGTQNTSSAKEAPFRRMAFPGESKSAESEGETCAFKLICGIDGF